MRMKKEKKKKKRGKQRDAIDNWAIKQDKDNGRRTTDNRQQRRQTGVGAGRIAFTCDRRTSHANLKR